MNTAINYLADHPWLVCALLVTAILIAGQLDQVLA